MSGFGESMSSFGAATGNTSFTVMGNMISESEKRDRESKKQQAASTDDQSKDNKKKKQTSNERNTLR